MSYPTISACVLSLLNSNFGTHKEIANKVREFFPDAATTDKSVASLKRDFKKKGLLGVSPQVDVEPENDPRQISMIPLLEA